MGVSRFFIAIPVSASIRQKLSDLQFSSENIKWVPNHQLHLTLKFAGDLNSDESEMLTRKLKNVQFAAFNISIEGVGIFPESGSPRVLWSGVMAPEALSKLRKRIATISEKCGANADKYPYKPHVTLARVKKDGIKRHEVMERLHSGHGRQFGTMEVNQFILYKSILDKAGAKHIAMHTYHSV